MPTAAIISTLSISAPPARSTQERMTLNLALDAFNVFNRQNMTKSLRSTAEEPSISAAPSRQHYGDAASLAIQRGQVACPARTEEAHPRPTRCSARRGPCSTRGNCRPRQN